MLQSVTWCYTVLRSVTKCDMVLHSVTRCYTVLDGVTRCKMPMQRRMEMVHRVPFVHRMPFPLSFNKLYITWNLSSAHDENFYTSNVCQR